MTRYCYDSTTASDLPSKATLVLAYLDGLYANWRAVRVRCPNARIATVTVLGNLRANMADCETGDLTPESAARWACQKRGAKLGFPTIYCLDSQHDAVIAACKAHGLTLGKHYLLFVANYDNKPTLPWYAVGKQYANPPLTGHHYDKSIVRAYWRGVDPVIRAVLAPVAPKPPAPVAPTPAAAPAPSPVPLVFLGVRVGTIRKFLAGRLAWAKAHPRKAKAELAAFFTVLAASPAIHALIHHQPYTTTGLLAAVTAAVVAAARKNA